MNRLSVKPSRIYGKVKVSGAKNSVLRLMAASLLTDDDVIIENYPSELLDAQVHKDMLTVLGKSCSVRESTIQIKQSEPLINVLKWDGRSIRNTLLILGALVAKTGRGSVPLPGGCSIGDASGGRAFDLHVMLLERLGARVWEENGHLCAEVEEGKFQGADIHLPIRSTGATENALICGSLALGVTRIWNPHIRPEILDLVSFLRSMGAEIKVFGQEHIEIIGKEGLLGVRHKVIPDNVEALTWLVAAAVTGGEVEIEDFPYNDLEVPLIHLKESGARLYRYNDSMIVKSCNCYPLELSTGPYPGINSDMQPILAVYAAMATGQSKFIDLRFPGRYGYANELNKMGLASRTEGNMLVIEGGAKLVGAEVKALDLRAGIALMLAGLMAKGETVINDAWQISRGYDQLLPKLEALGASVKVVD